MVRENEIRKSRGSGGDAADDGCRADIYRPCPLRSVAPLENVAGARIIPGPATPRPGEDIFILSENRGPLRRGTSATKVSKPLLLPENSQRRNDGWRNHERNIRR
jgi:hypothetical protein